VKLVQPGNHIAIREVDLELVEQRWRFEVARSGAHMAIASDLEGLQERVEE
jgi:hypothetical protein